MKEILSVDVMRRSDAAAIAAGTPGAELMRRAAEGIFHALSAWQGPVAIVCGSGNNAGDGYALALLLQDAEVPCTLFLREERFSEDGRFYFDQCVAREIPVRFWQDLTSLQGWPTVVDCIFGTGFHGEPAGEDARMISLINGSGAYVVSVDINSGLNGDSGLAAVSKDPVGPDGRPEAIAVRSSLTVSIGSYKPGHFLNMAPDLIGRLVNCVIGIPPIEKPMQLIEAEDLRPLFPPRPHFSHKGDWGYLALFGGSLRYSGAIRLASLASGAMRAGAGVVRICAPRSLCPLLIPHILESTLFPLSDREGDFCFREEEFNSALRGVKAVAFGMGIGHTGETEKAVLWLLSHGKVPLLLDADGLNALAAVGTDALDAADAPVVLTPHPGEFARLTGRSVRDIQNAPVPLAEAFAKKHRVIVLLKGTATVVTDGTETFLVNRGCPGMATAGSGDVLSGILSALLAAHPDRPLEAAAGAAFLAGRAGELAQEKYGDVSMLAGDTAAFLPEAIREIRGS